MPLQAGEIKSCCTADGTFSTGSAYNRAGERCEGRKLEEVLSKPWAWALLPNNCVAFVEDIVAAGGATWSSASNCPAIAITDGSDVARLFNMLEASIYSAYGVPR